MKTNAMTSKKEPPNWPAHLSIEVCCFSFGVGHADALHFKVNPYKRKEGNSHLPLLRLAVVRNTRLCSARFLLVLLVLVFMPLMPRSQPRRC